MGLLDLVTIDDKVIGNADYIEIHKRGLRHGSVNILAVNANGELAVAERSGNQDVSAHKYHVSAGGHNRLGQSYKWAMFDQLQDELFHGQSLPEDPVINEIARYQNDTRPTNNENTVLYLFNSSGPFNLNPQETSQIFWKSVDEINDDLTDNHDNYTNTFRKAFHEYCEFLESD